MSRGRIQVRVMVHCSFGFAHDLAYQSIGLESRGHDESPSLVLDN